MARNIASSLVTGTAALGIALGSIFGHAGSAQAQDATPTAMTPQDSYSLSEVVNTEDAITASQTHIVLHYGTNLSLGSIQWFIDNVEEQGYPVLAIFNGTDETSLIVNGQSANLTSDFISNAVRLMPQIVERSGFITEQVSSGDEPSNDAS